MALTDHVDGLVHEPTQTSSPGLDLTAAAVARVTDAGRVDFGGGELGPAGAEALTAERRSPDDDYGWWTMAAGVYLLQYNETLAAPPGRSFVLQTRRAVRERGAFHPTVRLGGDEGLGRVPLTVGDGGIALKENARVSTLLPA